MNQTPQASRDSVDELQEALEEAPEVRPMKAGADAMEPEMMGSIVKRRAFLQRVGVAGVGVAAIGLLNGCDGDDDDNGGPSVPNPTATASPTGGAVATPRPTAVPIRGIDQVNFPGIVGRNINEVVLNYALALEIFEADIYRQSLNIASGLPITTPFSATRNYTLAVPDGGLNQGSQQATQDGFTLLKNITIAENAHRDFLRGLLRSLGAPVQPANPGGYQFPGGARPGSSLRAIFSQLRPIETNGPRAYLGAAPFLTTLTLIRDAGTIYSVECRQAAAINDILGLIPGPTRMALDKLVVPSYPSEDTFEYFRSPGDVLREIVPAFFRADGSTNPSDGSL